MIARAIKTARAKLGISQAELAKRLGMKRPYVCNLEKDAFKPKQATLRRLAAALEMSEDAFLDLVARFNRPHELVPVRGQCAELEEVWSEVETREAEICALEDARHILSSTSIYFAAANAGMRGAGEIVAASMRTALGVGSAAIPDLAWTLEFANARVVALPFDGKGQSASWWNPARNTLTIAIDSESTPERQTYRLAYELGAACLFRSAGDITIRGRKSEHRFLTEFAAAFLMPASTVMDMVAKSGISRDGWTMPHLLAFKSHFGVSAETFALRLEELGLITHSLRASLRDELRAYYRANPSAMEPSPTRHPLAVGARVELLKSAKGNCKEKGRFID